MRRSDWWIQGKDVADRAVTEDGLDGAEWAGRIEWVAAPDPECLVDVRFLVSDVLAG